jgi:WD40 repeat protein
VLATPHAEIRAAGATFTCSVGTEATRVETEAGQVQVIRQADSKTIDLPVGTYAISTAEADDELTPRTLLAKAVIPRAKIRLSGPALAQSPDGQRLATSSQNELAIWNTRTGQRELAMPARREEVGCLAFSAGGRRVASGGVEAGLYLWDLEQRKQLSRWDTPLPLRTLTYSFDGRRLASASHRPGQPGEVQVWDAATGQDRRLLTGSILSLAFSPNGKRLAGRSQDRGVLIWDADTGKEIAMLKSTPKKERVELVAYSADGRWLAAALHGKGIRLWDAASLVEKWFFPSLGRQCRSLAISADGRTLAAGSQDGTLFLWDLENGTEIMSQKVDPRAVRLLAFAADGATLTVVGESGALQQWGVPR